MERWVSNSGNLEIVMAGIVDDDDDDPNVVKTGDQFIDEYGDLVMVGEFGQLILVE